MIRVMVVTNREEVLEGLGTILKLAGDISLTDSATSLESAVQQVCIDRPDVVLVDLEMPGGEGYETIRRLAQTEPRTKVIALTAHDYPAAQENAIRAGAVRVMLKGLDVAEMVALIQEAAGEQRRGLDLRFPL